MSIENRSSRRSEILNYSEEDRNQELETNYEIIETIISEAIKKASNGEEINRRKQMKKALNKEQTEDWLIEESKTLH